MNAGTIATYMMIYGIIAIPASLIGGKLADTRNKRNIIIFCDLVSIISYIYCSLTRLTFFSIIIFAVASLFQFIERASYDALVADFTTSADRERAYSLSYLGANLGLVLSPTIGGILFNNYLNLTFLINGCSIALSTILIFLFIKDIHREEDTSTASQYETALEPDISTFNVIKSHRVIAIFIVLSALCHATYNMYNYLMPLDLGQIHGDHGSVLFGSMTSVNCIVVVIFTAIITKVSRCIFDTDKLLLGEFLMLISYIIFAGYARITILCYLCMFIFTIGEIYNTLASSPFLTRRIPASHRGRIISVINVCCQLTASALQLPAGYLYDHFGSMSAWILVCATCMLFLIIAMIMKKLDRLDYKALYENKGAAV